MNAQRPPPRPRRDEDVLLAVPPQLDSSRLDAPTRRMAVAMTLLIWGVNIAVGMFWSGLAGSAELGGLLAARVLTAAGGILICFAIHLVITWLGHRSFAMRALTVALIVPFAAIACYWISYFSKVPFAPEWIGRESPPGEWLRSVISWGWYFLAWSALYLALRYSYEVKASERRARVIEGLAHAAQLRALQNQIGPHFMFNTLNSISALMLDGKVERAEAMLRRLSDFLRSTLALDALADISLAEELRIQLMYLDIEQARFPDMKVTVDYPAELGNALVPALITQPIVENAVKYGVARSLRPTGIAISAARARNDLVLTIKDDGGSVDAAASGLGVGLRNVGDRLRGRFGTAHRFSAGPSAGGGFEVTLTLPLSFAKR